MELKITADSRFLEAIEKLAEAIHASLHGQQPKLTAASAIAILEEANERLQARRAEPVEPDRTEPAPQEEEQAISPEDVKHLAIRMIQGGQRDAVKALLDKYGAARVGDIPDDKLADFKKDLDSLK